MCTQWFLIHTVQYLSSQRRAVVVTEGQYEAFTLLHASVIAGENGDEQ